MPLLNFSMEHKKKSMKKIGFLLKLEWSKYRKNNTMMVFALSALLLFPIACMLLYSFTTRVIPEEFPLTLYEYPNLWALTGYISNWITYFLVVITGIYIITLEYSHKTLRQNVITGLRRIEFLQSKILFVLLYAITLTIWYIIVTLLFGLFAGESLNFDISSDSMFFLSHFLMVFAYGVLGMFFGLVFKSLGLGFILFFLYASFLEPIFSRLVHGNLIGGDSHLFYPANAFKDLMPFPFYSGLVDLMPPDQQFKMALTTNESIIASILYLGLLILIMNRKINRSDL